MTQCAGTSAVPAKGRSIPSFKDGSAHHCLELNVWDGGSQQPPCIPLYALCKVYLSMPAPSALSVAVTTGSSLNKS